MPKRKVPLETNHFYHIYLHALDDFKVFSSYQNKKLFTRIIDYYQHQKPPVSFSTLCRNYSAPEINLIFKNLKEEDDRLVDIISFCCVSNHFHFTLRQIKDRGISLFMKQVLSSFGHIYNNQNERKGSLFRSRFKSRLIKNDEDLIHLTIYHHLHPYTNNLVASVEEVFNYPFSSLPAYFNQTCLVNAKPDEVLKIISQEEYRQSLLAQAKEQKELEKKKREENPLYSTGI